MWQMRFGGGSLIDGSSGNQGVPSALIIGQAFGGGG